MASNTPVLTDEDRKHAETRLEEARLMASTHLPLLLNRLVERAVDPGAPNKTVLDAAEFAYKVSGLAKRQEETNDKGRFIFNINFKGGTVTVDREKVIEHDPEQPVTVDNAPDMESEALVMLDNIPQHIMLSQTLIPMGDDLELNDGDFDD